MDGLTWLKVDSFFEASYKDISGVNTLQFNRAMGIDEKFQKISRGFTDAMGPMTLMLDTINSGQQISYSQMTLALKRSLTLSGSAMASVHKARLKVDSFLVERMICMRWS